MPSLCVFEAEAVGYGVRGGPAHGVLAADHVRPVDLAPVVRGERDRGTVRVGDQEGHGAGPAASASGKFAPVAYTTPSMPSPCPVVHSAIRSLVS